MGQPDRWAGRSRGSAVGDRIPLRLPPHLLRAVARAARRIKLPRSALIRQILEERFAAVMTLRKKRLIDRIHDLIGSLEGDPPNVARNHQKYLGRLLRDPHG